MKSLSTKIIIKNFRSFIIIILLVLLFYSSMNVSALHQAQRDLGVVTISVMFRVVEMRDDASVNPVSDAIIVVGVFRAKTNSDGVAQLEIPPGEYSSYITLPDPMLAPFMDKLTLKSNAEIEIKFKVVELIPELIILDVDTNSSTITFGFLTPNADRVYMSDPKLCVVMDDGATYHISPGQNRYGYFNKKLQPNQYATHTFIIDNRVPYVGTTNTSIPIQLIYVTKKF